MTPALIRQQIDAAVASAAGRETLTEEIIRLLGPADAEGADAAAFRRRMEQELAGLHMAEPRSFPLMLAASLLRWLLAVAPLTVILFVMSGGRSRASWSGGSFTVWPAPAGVLFFCIPACIVFTLVCADITKFRHERRSRAASLACSVYAAFLRASRHRQPR